jgi:murein DD-endopeptidase MepM/ murein hydrolase activator NlpD
MEIFKFNNNTLNYDKIKEWKIVRKWILISSLLMFILINIFYLCIITPREQILISKNKKLIQKYEYLDFKINYGFKNLYKLKQKDEYLYNNIILNNQNYGIGGIDQEIDSINLYSYFDFKVSEFLNQINKQNISLDTVSIKINDLSNQPSILPFTISNYNIPSRFGLRYHPILKTVRLHAGIDFGLSENTNIYATAHGIIKRIVYSNKGYGNYILIQHENNIQTRYAHLNQIFVKENDTIYRGQLIGLSGNTGLSTGPHLHYEVLKYNKPTNPEKYILFDEIYTKKLIENL